MKNRILLVHLSTTRNYPMEEIGIAYIASTLRSKGYEVKIIGGVEEDINYNELVEYKPSVVGLTLYKVNKLASYKFCENIRAIMGNNVHITAGGYLASYHDEDVLKENKLINTIIRGEGEYIFLELMEFINSKKSISEVKGLTYITENGDIVRNESAEYIENLSDLPFPARDYLIEKKLNIALVCTSRGCKGNCNFCIARSYWGKWRGRAVDNIIEELKELNKLGIKNVNFVDTSFEDPDYKCERMYSIAKAIVDNKIEIKYFIDVRAEFYRKCSKKLIEILKESGLIMTLIGIEAGNEKDLKVYGKIANSEDNEKCLNFFSNNDILVNIGFINFNPYSEVVGLRENIDFLERNGFAFDMYKITSRYQLAKGSRLYERIKDDGLLLDGNYDDLYNYKFKDSKVGMLNSFLNERLAIVNKETKNAYLYFSQLIYYKLMLYGMKETFKRMQDIELNLDDAIKTIDEHLSEVNFILKEVNSINANYIRKLIDLAEYGWNEESALIITENNMGIERLSEFITILSTKKAIFYRKMIKNYKKHRVEIDSIFFNYVTL